MLPFLWATLFKNHKELPKVAQLGKKLPYLVAPPPTILNLSQVMPNWGILN
jgi:hypothetical protein